MFDLNVEVEKLFQQTEVIFMSILHPGLLMYFVANEKNCSSSRNTQYCSVSQQEEEEEGISELITLDSYSRNCVG